MNLRNNHQTLAALNCSRLCGSCYAKFRIQHISEYTTSLVFLGLVALLFAFDKKALGEVECLRVVQSPSRGPFGPKVILNLSGFVKI